MTEGGGNNKKMAVKAVEDKTERATPWALVEASAMGELGAKGTRPTRPYISENVSSRSLLLAEYASKSALHLTQGGHEYLVYYLCTSMIDISTHVPVYHSKPHTLLSRGAPRLLQLAVGVVSPQVASSSFSADGKSFCSQQQQGRQVHRL